MLAPHELKNSPFTKSLRGYSTIEVDEHIDFLIEKYTELYRLNDELEKKLRLTEAQLDALKAEEDSIRTTLVNAQKAGTRIINEANERADVIMRSAKTNCDRLLAEFKASAKVENQRLEQIKREIAVFKASLFEAYQQHIEQVESIAPEVKIETFSEGQAEELAAEVMGRIRSDLSGQKPLISGSDDPFTPSLAEEEEEVEEEYGLSAETPIPDTVEEMTEVATTEEPVLDIRDEEVLSEASFENEPEEDEFPTERRVIEDDKRGGIVDSIRKLNNDARAFDDDDEELLSMLGRTASRQDESDMTSTDEFEMVYDRNNNK